MSDRAFVTGVCGFIGSRLAASLLSKGYSVIGIDSFLDSYPREIKEDRLADLLPQQGFDFVEADLACIDLDGLLDGVSYIFHLAAQAGVRTSWGQRFEVYANANILSTQKLLEAAKGKSLKRLVYSSSSSVYGSVEIMPTPEEAPLQPLSPYAVTKLAGEHLCELYRVNYQIPAVVLRYFTVYGPKPRPDQAVCIFTRALIEENEIQMYGDGEQLRGMTYVDDVVRANLLASHKDCVGKVFNIGGGSSITMNQLIVYLEELTGKKANVRYLESVKGDARHTLAEITKASESLEWVPNIEVEKGLSKVVDSIRKYYYPE